MIIFWQHPNENVCPKGGEFVDAEFNIHGKNCLSIKIKSDLFVGNFGTEKMACSYGNVINPETLEVLWDARWIRAEEYCEIPDMLQLAIRYANWKEEQRKKDMPVDKPDNT